MRVSQRVPADFHDPNRVSVAGLVPALAVAERAGLHEVAAERVAGSAGGERGGQRVRGGRGNGGRREQNRGLGRARARGDEPGAYRGAGPDGVGHATCGPTRLGTCASWTRSPPGRRKASPGGSRGCWPGDQVAAYLDIDDTIRETDGYAKQGATYGCSCQVPGLTETSKAGGLTDGRTPGVSGGAGGAVGEVPRSGIRTWSKTGPSNAWSGVAEIRFHHDHLPSPS